MGIGGIGNALGSAGSQYDFTKLTNAQLLAAAQFTFHGAAFESFSLALDAILVLAVFQRQLADDFVALRRGCQSCSSRREIDLLSDLEFVGHRMCLPSKVASA